MPNSLIPIVSLFSGAGGLDLGFRQQGFIPLLALDSNQIAVDTYNLNHPDNVARKADLSRISGSEVIALIEACKGGLHPRGVIGGPPCQAFSKGNAYNKPDDIRRKLPLRYAEILGVLNQRYRLDFFVFENVTGLRLKKHRKDFELFLERFDEAGFNVFSQELDASRFDVAQIRRRIFVVGLNKEIHPKIEFKFPPGNDTPPLWVRDKIWGLPEPTYFRRDLTPESIPFHPNHWTMQPKSPKFKNGGTSTTSRSRSFRRLNWDQPSWTVAYGHNEIHVHPNGHRRLSIFEAMLLQGFSREYQLLGNLSQQVGLVSDAVPPPLAAALAEAVRGFLRVEEG